MSRFVGTRLGVVQASGSNAIEVDTTFETMPAVLFDALVVPDFRHGTVSSHSADAVQFIHEQYRHCKPILVRGTGKSMIESAGVKLTLPSGEPDPGILYIQGGNLDDILPQFVETVAARQHFERAIEPPRSM